MSQTPAAAAASPITPASARKPRVAAITTVWRKDSHADVLIPKLIAGYDVNGTAAAPSVEVVSLYVDQFPENDLSRAWARRFDIPIVDSVRDALTIGASGASLGVDAVLIVGEHGEYPWNEKGQHLYPRRQLFEQCAAVMREAGRAVPLFTDKHLSYTWENTRWMYDTARDLGMPLMAGSSLPVTLRRPDLEFPLGVEVAEALVLSTGPTESYGFHALETLQCLVERRGSGETGVAAVELLHGDALWQAFDAGRIPHDLYDAVLATCDHEPGSARDWFAAHPPRGNGGVPGPKPPVAFFVEYRDGLRATLINLAGYNRDFAFGARLSGQSRAVLLDSPACVAGTDLVATAFKLEKRPPRWHFNLLAHHVERFFVSGTGPYPVERTLLTTGTLEAAMNAGAAGHKLETPHLDVTYQPPAEPWLRANGQSLPPEQVWGFTPDAV
jgi:hypothetical protein